MRHKKHSRTLYGPWVFTVIAIVGWLSLVGAVTAATPQYRVAATVTHLGETVAAPIIIVEENTTASVERNDPEQGHFRMAILIRPHAGDEVSVSLSYRSGKVSAQPNVIVPLGEDYEVTANKLLIGLRIDPVASEEG